MFKETCTIILKPTHRCNFNCVYCYDRFERAAHSEIMSAEQCIRALEKIFIMYGPNYKFQIIGHGGEPTTLGVDYLAKVMEYFKQRRDTYEVYGSIQTNGSLLDEDWFEMAKKYDLHIGVSGDGITTNESRLSAKNKTDIVKIANLSKTYDAEVGLLMVVTPKNADTLILSFETARALGLKVSFNPLFGEGIDKAGYLKIATGFLELFDYLLQIEHVRMYRPFEFIFDYLGDGWSSLCEHNGCSNKWLGLAPNGNISQCGKPGGDDLIWGNIFNQDITLEQIENSKMSKILKDASEQQGRHCKDCKGMSVCMNGCLFTGWDAKTQTYHIDEDFCFYQKFLGNGFMDTIRRNCENNTLKNKQVIDAIHRSVRGDLLEGKNYKYPTI